MSKSKLNGKNKVIAINKWTVSVLRYGAGIIRRTKEELKTLDFMTRMVLTRMVLSIQKEMLIGCMYQGRMEVGD